ncbi:peptidoglycan glycosyltransferase [Oscillochloris trichoides DG-6]|uniref:Peptidoglycan glycosyltransferase n=1 Tax=Oscillochloris trichoides DG-6 TaxID=765420 RepID=E1IBS0_9CHLR|nr:penicillin-binding transpeptidase domain-containing protein [Oscillochloris trichoides]EFO81372.1 peptidoglycan glycosyltransferase [Oscillochloris trichoides DG-6]
MGQQPIIRTGLLIGALALISYGIFQPVEADTRWLICLWLAAPLLGLAAWMVYPAPPAGLARTVYHVGLIILLGFGLLSLQLLRQQFVKADAIYNYVAVGPDGSTTSNVRPVLSSQRVLRGQIVDRNGVVLADSQSVNGFARRTYPVADRYDPAAFSNILGFFSTRYGQSGLESTYSAYLTGERGNELQRLQEQFVGGERRGNTLVLTINAELQARAAQALAGRAGSIVVLDPRTGAILAMVSQPGFDPRGLSFDPSAASWDAENARVSAYWAQIIADSAGQPLLNRPTQGLYPPGSTFKTLTAIAALAHPGVGQPDSITCPQEYRPDPTAPPVVNAVDNLASLTGDPTNLEKVYAYSCNTAFAQYATRLGPELFAETARQFDIFPPQRANSTYNEFTDLPTATSLLYVNPGFLNLPRGMADTGYGQGQLLVTPLQMAMMTAAIGNEGILMRPYLVQRITRPDGSLIVEQTPRPIRRATSALIAQTMRSNMAAVGSYGFGRVISDYVPGIAVGGKSGTAEHVPGAVPHAWFIALAPLDQPRYAVAVMVESGGEGSSVGARLAGEVLAAAFATE